ncbi:DegV family protein [Anaerocaecibacter muris]|uniref:DegV family protein n=1 Tax=Anaerocaecibacter muris TaxID=2941513 RepID=UPI00203E28BB|nr:DegV family protein [Anaerocaecibacter muris]
MIKLLVDSASDIDLTEARDLGIELIPMLITIGEKEYSDGVGLSHKEFFEKLIESDELPQTSQINECRFDERFSALTANGDDVIAIVLSSKLSGTYDCACRAAQKYDGKVRVVDSLNASAGERILCMHAVKLINEGRLSAAEIVDELNIKKTKIRFLALLGTLEYLKKGGRISSVVAFAGEMFSIKPVVSVTDGEVKLVGKAMGSKRGSNLLSQFIDKYGVNFDMPFALVYSGLTDEFLTKYITDSEKLWVGKTDYLPKYLIGSTIGTHIGPGAIGVAFFTE